MLPLLLHLVFPVTSLPTDNGAPSPATNLALTPPLPSSSNLFSPLPPPSPNDWENFAYPIPHTKQMLKGRIFTSRRIKPRALHFMIDGGIARTRAQISELGNIGLRIKDNPYLYSVPGCHFRMESKMVGERPVMTYRMMMDVFLALEKVLEKTQRDFEASFVLTDGEGRSWGHGSVAERGVGRGGF